MTKLLVSMVKVTTKMVIVTISHATHYARFLTNQSGDVLGKTMETATIGMCQSVNGFAVTNKSIGNKTMGST